MEHRIFTTAFADIYPHYVAKAQRKARTQAEVDEIVAWLTGYDAAGLNRVLTDRVDVRTFFDESPAWNPASALITGVICGHRVEQIEDPLMQKVRYLDKLVDELAKGKAMPKILRNPAETTA